MEQTEKIHLSEKQVLRNRYLAYRNALSLSERREMSAAIRERLKKESAYQNAQLILVYMDYRSEVITTPLVEELLSSGQKSVYAPRVEGMNIHFFKVTSMEDFSEGYQGIREPAAGSRRFFNMKITEEKNCMVLVPGAVFDRSRGRLGYGKGFYDRFLSQSASHLPCSAALAFDCQLAGKVPMGDHDCRPDMIITNTEVIR